LLYFVDKYFSSHFEFIATLLILVLYIFHVVLY